MAANGAHADVRLITTGISDANRDRISARVGPGVGGERRGVTGGAAAGVAQLGVCGHHLGQPCRVRGLCAGVRVESEQKRSVGRADLGRGGVARDAEHAVRVV
ncbi:hypothetical protein L6E10_24260 [Lentzea sp. CC55]|nr:hypothetical protein [Lentzea sp. CC55]MCG8925533.1 hypothetical protein [Lentzea sp. CC55]